MESAWSRSSTFRIIGTTPLYSAMRVTAAKTSKLHRALDRGAARSVGDAMVKKWFMVVILMSLIACDSTSISIQDETITFSQADQQFSIVPFYLTMPTYVEKARENGTQINRLYRRYVYGPIWDDFASKGECSFLAKNIENPITDLDGLDTEIGMLSSSGAEEIVKEALLKVSKVLPGPNTTVYLQAIDPSYKKAIPSNGREILEMGIHADTYGTGRIFISIDPTAKNWRSMLPRVVAHEYHHSVWISRNFETVHFRLLDCLVLEGRAEGFADLCYPNIEVPWPELDTEKEQRVWQRMRPVLHSKDEQLIMRMFVGDEEIPFLSVYSMGHRIVQEFLKNNPDTSLMAWTDMEPDEILSRSKYEEKLSAVP